MSVTPKVSAVRRLPRTRFRWRFPDRALHVVDIENLVGTAVPTLHGVSQVQGQYLSCLRFGADDQVVIGSGDGMFGRSAASLADRGVYVTVVSRRGSLAYDLARVASDVIYLDG